MNLSDPVHQEAVIVVPYDPKWPGLYAQEAERLLALFSGTSTLAEPIGSTAVPGLGGKPVMDILLGVYEFRDVEERVSGLEALGYRYIPEFEEEIPDRRFFIKSHSGVRTHHLHVVELSGEHWRHHLLLRDYLRAHPKICQEYEQVKIALAEKFKDDRAAYTEGKSGFLKKILAEATQGFCPYC